MSNLFPDLVETEFNLINALSLRLPATVVGINSDLLMEIIAEYGKNSQDNQDLIVNVWAREVGAVVSGFITSIHLQAKENEQPLDQATRIISTLNASEVFREQLSEFIIMLIHHK